MSGAYMEVLRERDVIVVPLPSPNGQGGVQFGRVVLSLRCARGTVRVSVSVVAEGNEVIHEDNVQVPSRGNVSFEIEHANAAALIVHRAEFGAGSTVGVLVEYEDSPIDARIDLQTVEGIQRALAALGFDPGPIDGDNGPVTQAAVRAFQRQAGLEANGIVDPLTRAALASALAELFR